MPDPSLPPSTPPWCVRHRAAALVTHGGRVLLHQLDGDSFWALPGGAIEPGESACDALARELQEELGADRGACIAVGSLAVVAENFFAYGGVSYHEIGLYLRANPLPGNPLAATDGPYDGVEGARRLVFAWFSAGVPGRLFEAGARRRSAHRAPRYSPAKNGWNGWCPSTHCPHHRMTTMTPQNSQAHPTRWVRLTALLLLGLRIL